MGNFKNELGNYQPIPRELVFDKSLSDRARFVYVFMACKPDGWDFFLEPMAKEIGYSVDTLRKYINELVDNGWLVKGEQVVNENGKFGAVEYTLKASKCLPIPNFTDTGKTRHGKIPTQDNKDYKEKRDIENIKELKEKFSAFVKQYKKLTNKQTRSVETEFKDFTNRHRDWKQIIPLLSIAIERETKARNNAIAMHKFFPEPKMLQTYLGKQRAWEMYVNPNEDVNSCGSEYCPTTGGALTWNDYYNCYIYTSMFVEDLADGYNDNNRPDGATIMLNNGRGYIVWNSTSKKWESKK